MSYDKFKYKNGPRRPYNAYWDETVNIVKKKRKKRNRIPRKLKKKLIQCFGYMTYWHIKNGDLKLMKNVSTNMIGNFKRAHTIKQTDGAGPKSIYHAMAGQILVHTHLIP